MTQQRHPALTTTRKDRGMAEHLPTDYREAWKQVPSWPDLEASEFGHIRRISDGRIMGQHLDGAGYHTVVVGEDRLRRRTSGLVCEAFHGPRPHRYNALHNNGVKTDNRANNLRWGTQNENIQDKYLHGTIGFGEANGFAKLNEDAVREIRRLCEGGRYGGGARQRDIAARFNISQGAVSAIIKRKTWSHVK